ncbi:MAG: 4-(cytidine 5'-diphospho)-2-C-methyl-D-erythritol kinase [Planctomycetota bacterium]
MTPRSPRAAEEVRRLAPAKVNLGLEVRGRRPDGYHEIDTTILALDLADEVSIRGGAGMPGISLALAGPALSPDVPGGAENLAWRAAEHVLALARAAGSPAAPRRLEIRLVKRIPARAGLGGGSSDAAAALGAAAELLGLELAPEAALAALAALGSDCPFFHAARATGLARCTGRGEIVAPIAGRSFPWWIALVAPAIECATAAVYAALAPRAGRSAPAFDLERVLAGSLAEARSALGNDLEPAAVAAFPELARWRAELDRADAGHFRLAGSGAAFYGLFADRAAAAAAVARISARAAARDLAVRGRWCLRAAASAGPGGRSK